MSYEHLLVDDEPAVRIITLNRPDKFNSWNAAMRAEMRAVIEDTAMATGIRAVVITGAGRAFSAGEDVSEMADLTEMGTRGFRAVARGIHSVFDLIEALEVPVIAAVNGVAAGGGFELALSCDFRIIAENAGRTVAAFCHGMVTMQFLRRILGYDDVHALRVDYCGISRVQASSSRPVRSIRSVNETAHLGETRIVSP